MSQSDLENSHMTQFDHVCLQTEIDRLKDALLKSQAEAELYWNEIKAMDEALSQGDRNKALVRVRMASTLKPFARIELKARLKTERERCAKICLESSRRPDDIGAIFAHRILALSDT